jgi:glycosyltransferase involved in cell wall biosynthesis
MKTLINLYNQIGAGPKNISLNLIHGLAKSVLSSDIYIIIPDHAEYSTLESSNPKLHLLKYPRKQYTLSKVWFRLYLELWLIPRLMHRYAVKQLLAFGNFLFTPGNFNKLVLCHHPYLYDNALLSKLTLPSQITEYLKRVAFGLTLWNVRHLVVQSDYVESQLRATWKLPKAMQLHVIPNPISNSFQKADLNDILSLIEQRSQRYQKTVKILYVSRFYPHKNHQFLISLSSALKNQAIAHEIQVTVDPTIESAQSFLQEVSSKGLPIINLGERDQKEIADIYQQSDLFIFPSNAETFGNPMIEAMCYGLPLVLPDLGYARAIASSAGNYYYPDDAVSCATLIKSLLCQSGLYKQRSIDSYGTFSQFQNVEDWIMLYLQTLQQNHQES